MSAVHLDAQSGTKTWVVAGLVAGLISGIVFLVFEMLAAGILTASAFGPPRMMGATVLGEGALPPQPTLGLAAVLPVALLVHFALSGAFGVVFGAAAGILQFLRSSRAILIAAATVFGLGLWIVNFYVMAPILGWNWFAMANPVVQFVAHTFVFGLPVGLLIAFRAREE
ncbi:hypothetical protein BH23ACT11_BH23ACT11_13000 [soil metagenome]